MKLRTLKAGCAFLMAAVLASCSAPKEVMYFTDLKTGQENIIPVNPNPLRLQPHDKVTILVITQDARLNALYNLPVARTTLGNSGSDGDMTSNAQGNVSPYTIDSQGNINFPVLGKLHIAGMTREELAEYIRRELISRDLAKNPIVTVEYLNLGVSVLGEVGRPGRIQISREDFTILEALSLAGDITIFGKKDNIRVLREENGVQKVYEIDLNSGKDLTKSPVYFLRQNDVIYVEPNSTKKRNSTPNGNQLLTPGFWISIASFGMTVALFVITLTKK